MNYYSDEYYLKAKLYIPTPPPPGLTPPNDRTAPKLVLVGQSIPRATLRGCIIYSCVGRIIYSCVGRAGGGGSWYVEEM